MKKLKKIWDYLNGKKTIIATVYWTLLIPILTILYPDGYPKILMIATTIFGGSLSCLGLGHKAIKARNK